MRIEAAIAGLLGAAVCAGGLAGPPTPGSETTVAKWIAQLKEGDDEARWRAARALERLGPAARSAVPALIAALADDADEVGRKSAEALGRMGAPAVEPLVESLASRDGWVRRNAAAALAAIRPEGKDAALALGQLAGDWYRPARHEALKALRAIGPAAAPATAALLAALASPDAMSRRRAAESLGATGPHTDDVVCGLALAAERDGYKTVKDAARAALKRLGVGTVRVKALVAAVGPKPRLWPPPTAESPPRPVRYRCLAELLKVYPQARRQRWGRPGQPAWTLVHTPRYPDLRRGMVPKRGHLAVFDKAGRPLYQRQLEGGTATAARRYSAPAPVPVAGRVLAYARSLYAPKTLIIHLVLVGIGPDKAASIELPYECSSSYPQDHSSRVWVEDVDGDGAAEICRFFRKHYHGGSQPPPVRLECLRWDPAKGEWKKLKRLAGRLEQKRRPPIRWRVLGTYDETRRTLDLRLKIENLSKHAVTIAQPAPLLVPVGHRATSMAPDPAFACPLIVRAGRARSRPDWTVLPRHRFGREMVIAGTATVTCRFQVSVPAGQPPGKQFRLRLTGRARWARLQSTFLEQYTLAFGREESVPAGAVGRR